MKFTNVYLKDIALVAGPLEGKSFYKEFFDKIYKDMYFGTKTFMDAEIKLQEDVISILLNKTKLNKDDIDIHIAGDLINQLGTSNFATLKYNFPFIGVYAACATSTLSILLAATLIGQGYKNIICTTSSHNSNAEKQFRYPNEYGAPKPIRSTYTATGAASILVTNKKCPIKVESATIGVPITLGITDVYNMGAVMAPAAAEVLYKHLNEMKRDIKYYDIIITGDLGSSGLEIFKSYLNKKYKIEYDHFMDAGTMLFQNVNKYMGGSGPVCLPLIMGYIKEKMLKKEVKRVLLLATGALHNTTSCNLKKPIPSISHAISLEMIK